MITEKETGCGVRSEDLKQCLNLQDIATQVALNFVGQNISSSDGSYQLLIQCIYQALIEVSQIGNDECFHSEGRKHVLCESANLSIEIDRLTGDIFITSRKEKYKPVTRKEDEKYIQIVLEKLETCSEIKSKEIESEITPPRWNNLYLTDLSDHGNGISISGKQEFINKEPWKLKDKI